jgi:hypothetical protein
MRLSIKRFIELAHCIEPARMCAVAHNQWSVQRLKGLWEKLSTKWEKRYVELDPALQSQAELGRRCALLRCEHEVGVAGV